MKGIPGRTADVDSLSYLFFSGFAYLGMPSLPAFQLLIAEGAQKYGAVFPSSRGSNTRNALYDDFENALSAFIGLPATASFSSGYLAAQAALQFAESKGRIYCLEGVHPSLKLTAGNAFSGSASFIIEQVNQSKAPCTVVLESVEPLTGRVSNSDWLLQINRPVRIIVDDSHGIGVLGEKGTGIYPHLPQSDYLHYLICYSLSKAFSCEGGAVSGEAGDILEIKTKAPFSAATPMSPLFVHAWMESRSCFAKQLNTLRRTSHYFADKIKDLPIQYDDRLPVCRLNNENLYGEALSYHIILSAFRYPTVKDPLMTRVVLNALHTEEDIDQLVNCIRHLSFS